MLPIRSEHPPTDRTDAIGPEAARSGADRSPPTRSGRVASEARAPRAGGTRASAVALLAATTVALGACGDGAGNDDSPPRAADALDWRACATERAPTLECATLAVPLVHDDPDDGRELLIDLARLPADGVAGGSAADDAPSRALVLNPGGPGARGTTLVEALAEIATVPAAVRARFDLVGFDPRGTGESALVDCEDVGYADVDDYLDDREAIERYAAETTAAAARCVERHGDVLEHLGSNAVVRDMELLREALGVETLDFLGYSYGTRLAALYLERFPERAGRFVLDGSVAPDGSTERLVAGQLVGFERNLEALFGDCGTRVPGCDYASFVRALAARIEALGAEDVDGPDGSGPLDESSLFPVLLLLALQDPEFGELAAKPLIGYVESGDVGVLVEFVALLEALGIDLEEAVGEDEDDATAARAVLCADDPARPDVDETLDMLARLEDASDLFAEAALALAVGCSGWPATSDPVGPITTRTAPPALVIGGTSDAQTLLEWAPEMAEAIGGVFLASDHPGHTVALQGESACVDAAVTAFLIEGTLPTSRSCTAEPAVAANGEHGADVTATAR